MHFFPYFSPPNVICFPSFILMQFFSLLNMIPFPLVKWNENVHENDFQERLTLGKAFFEKHWYWGCRSKTDMDSSALICQTDIFLQLSRQIWFEYRIFGSMEWVSFFAKSSINVVFCCCINYISWVKLIDLSVHCTAHNMAWFVFNQIYFMSKQIWYESHIWCVL